MKLTRRTVPTHLTIYRRHAKKVCKLTKTRILDACECPLWAHGRIQHTPYRESLGTRSLPTAIGMVRDLMNPSPDGGPPKTDAADPNTVTLEIAASKFHAAHETRVKEGKMSSRTLDNYRFTIGLFVEFAGSLRIEYLKDVSPDSVTSFAAAQTQWSDRTKTARLTVLKVFFRWCVDQDLMIKSPVRKSHNVGNIDDVERVAFTPEEITRILQVIECLEDPAERDRARALILLMLYTGMRISDATFAQREDIDEDFLQYTPIKTRKRLELPIHLQPVVLAALAKLPASRTFFFQADVADDYRAAITALRRGKKSKVRFAAALPGGIKWFGLAIRRNTKLVAKVLVRAGLKLSATQRRKIAEAEGTATLDGLCHRFRDTFAISMLDGGAQLLAVSKMLGHSSVVITEKHYVKLKNYSRKMSMSTSVLNYQLALPVPVAA